MSRRSKSPTESSEPSELNDYVFADTGQPAWRCISGAANLTDLEFTSQVWRGHPWRHRLIIQGKLGPSRVAVLYITGGEVNSADLADAAKLAELSGLLVAMLFNVPAQPLFDLSEDALIAHTFSEYLDQGEPDLPLVFPMAASVVRAMDVLEEWSQGELRRFIVMGESKRAWAAWMGAATGDRRVAGIVSCVFDNLNMAQQMAHQVELWGHYSPSLADYSDAGIQERAQSDRGRHLAFIVDPYSYRRRIHCPVLVVNGSNDPYWTPDASGHYLSEFRRISVCVLANEGHVFQDKTGYYRTAGAFCRSVSQHATFPSINHKLDTRMISTLEVGISGAGKSRIGTASLIIAEEDEPEFSHSSWSVVDTKSPPGKRMKFTLPTPSKRWQGAFVQVEFMTETEAGMFPFTVTTQVILRSRDEA